MDNTVKVNVDLAELNYYHKENGEVLLVQMIWWNRRKHESVVWSYRVVDYLVLSHNNGKFDHSPIPLERNGEWVSNFRYRGLDYSIRAKTYRETHTYYDPEAEDRFFMAEFNREGFLP